MTRNQECKHENTEESYTEGEWWISCKNCEFFWTKKNGKCKHNTIMRCNKCGEIFPTIMAIEEQATLIEKTRIIAMIENIKFFDASSNTARYLILTELRK